MTIKATRIYTENTNVLITIKDSKKNIDMALVVWNYSTSSSWGHKCRISGHYGTTECYGNYKARYYNRTYEAYTFQSVLHEALRDKLRYRRDLDEKKLKKFLDKFDNAVRCKI